MMSVQAGSGARYADAIGKRNGVKWHHQHGTDYGALNAREFLSRNQTDFGIMVNILSV